MSEFSPIPVGPISSNLPGVPGFYKHSGRVPANALLAGMLAAVLGGFVLGAVWGFVELYLHLAPAKLQIAGFIFGVGGLGMALGYLPAVVLIRFKARSPFAMFACTLVSAASAYYAAWIFFIFAWELYGQTGRPLWDIAGPVSLARDVKSIYDDGLWRLLGEEWIPTGIYLAMFWAVEFFTLLTIALRTAMKRLNKKTFCENCDTWGTARPIMEISDENWPALKKSLLAGNIDSLATVKPRIYAMPFWCDVTIEGCPTCDNVQTLTVTRIVVMQNKKGKTSTKKTDLVRRLVMTPEQTVQVAVIAAGLKGPVSEGARDTI
ncbi:MAG TPA: hypothetical protein VM008_02765 [Phycisphaerae bacterium]|nr:hypothetical protein [Phycisphaerae bacterium]